MHSLRSRLVGQLSHGAGAILNGCDIIAEKPSQLARRHADLALKRAIHVGLIAKSGVRCHGAKTLLLL
jgi:hypothetical protein